MREENVAISTQHVTPIAPLLRRISWGAVFAGLVIALVVQLVFSLLGIALGASTLDPAEGETPGKGMAIGAGIWWLVSGLISTYIGASIAAHLSGAVRKSDSVLHGLLTWAAATLVTAFLLTSALGNLIGGAMGMIGQTAGAAGQAAASGQVSIDTDELKQEAREAKREAQEAIGGTGAQGGQQQGGVVVNEQQARETGQKAAQITAQAAFWAFLMLLLGAGAAALGGAAGRRGVVLETRRTVEPTPAH